MKLTKPKRIYYIFIVLVCILSVFVFLTSIRSLNRKFNTNILQTVFTLYNQHMQSMYPSYLLNRLPFILIEDKSTNQTIFYDEQSNSIRTNDITKLNKVLSTLNLFDVTNNANITISSIKDFQIRQSKYLNLYFFISDDSDLSLYHECIERVSESTKFRKIFVKFIHYDKYKGVSQSDDLYSDLKSYNSKLLFEELEDKNIQHVLLHHKEKFPLNIFYNKDLDSDIFELDLRKDFNQDLLESLVYFTHLDFEEKQNIPNGDVLIQVIKIKLSNSFTFHQLLLKSIKNLDRINQIFPLYESIRSIEIVKEKFNLMQEFFIQLMKSKFDTCNIQHMMDVYMTTQYLLESNEMVKYEHYFSNEFKIGTFLPPMLPIVYGLIKAIKAINS